MIKHTLRDAVLAEAVSRVQDGGLIHPPYVLYPPAMAPVVPVPKRLSLYTEKLANQALGAFLSPPH